MAGVALSLAAQAAVEYVLMAGRSAFEFLGRTFTKVAMALGTPRGILIAAFLVFLLIVSLSRRHRW